ncbi:MAG: PKD domain-containing protein [Bacteroidales bacterium]|nr:PKD domain-containing protein [Bacteroidales bacterium]
MKKYLVLFIVIAFVLSGCQKQTPVAKFSFDSKPYLVDEEIVFTNESINAESYHWEFGDGHVSDELNPRHSYNTPGIYSVVLLANHGAQSDVFITRVTVEAPVTSYTFTNGFDVVIDQIQSFGLKDGDVVDMNFTFDLIPDNKSHDIQTRHQFIYCFLSIEDVWYITDYPFEVIVNHQNHFVIDDWDNLLQLDDKLAVSFQSLDNNELYKCLKSTGVKGL